MKDQVKVKNLNDAKETLVINLNDAKHKLEVTTSEKAQEIRNYMQNADIFELGDYKIITVTANAGSSNTELYVLCEDGIYRSLETTVTTYFCNDYNCKIVAARTGDRLKFLNDLDELTTSIGEECKNLLIAIIDKLQNLIN